MISTEGHSRAFRFLIRLVLIHLPYGTNWWNAREDCVQRRAVLSQIIAPSLAMILQRVRARCLVISVRLTFFTAPRAKAAKAARTGDTPFQPRDLHDDHLPRPGSFDDAPARTFHRRGSLLAPARPCQGAPVVAAAATWSATDEELESLNNAQNCIC